MNLYLIGHDYRYAAEQMLLTLFPDERPVYPDGRPTGDRAELRLMSGAKVTTATCVLVYQGRTANGRTSVPNEELTDPNETDRRLQGAVKRAFYRAAMGIGLPHRPWGMLTGVRPGKLMTPLLAQGMGDVQAARYFERHYDVAPARRRARSYAPPTRRCAPWTRSAKRTCACTLASRFARRAAPTAAL